MTQSEHYSEDDQLDNTSRHEGEHMIRNSAANPRSPNFAREAARQAALLRESVDEQEALAFIEAAFDWPCG
ncbi:MAG TPA: antitoxin MazE-like protein [Methylosinus sp.]